MYERYLKDGISCVFVDENKRAIVPWKIYQQQQPTEDELDSQSLSKKAHGIAVICGKVSGNLEIIDIDCKYDLTGSLFDNYLTSLPDELLAGLYIVATKNKGYHIYYRCESIEGNLKLASRPTTNDERKENPQDKVRVLIETRGEGGYCVAPPTDGYTLKSNVLIPTYTVAQRNALLTAARSFNEAKEEAKEHRVTSQSSGYQLSPFDDYNSRGVEDMLSRLTGAGWSEVSSNNKKVTLLRPGLTTSKSSGDYNYDLNWFSVFSTSTEFDTGKAYKPAAVFCKIECNDDWKLCAQKLYDAGYGEKLQSISKDIKQQVYRKKEEGLPAEDIAAFIATKHKMQVAEASKIIEQLNTQWGERICTFWEVSDKGGITIVRTMLQEFLSETGGFFLYYYDKNSPIFKIVRVVDGFVEEVTTEHLKKYVKDYINGLPETFDTITPGKLLEIILKGASTYFSDPLLEFMPRISLNLLKDTQTTAYFPFRNGIIKVTKDKKELLKYGDVGHHVWRRQVIDFNIDIDDSVDMDGSEYIRFIEAICNKDVNRVHYVISIIGYLLHKYKDVTKPFAVILAEETEKEKEGGGTGKGIFYKAISKMLNVVFVDGKNFKLDKSFAFQRVDLSTQLVVIEDCRKNVDFEGFYSNITEGVTTEKKNKDELYISYPDSPKFGFTTNYTINLTGNHAKRRGKIIEFSNFFHPGNTPLDHFGHSLFDGWDADEWNRFYNVMIECVQLYLSAGIPEQYSSDGLKRKQIKTNFGDDMLDYFTDMECGKWLIFSEIYNDFINTNEIDKKDYSQKRFKAGLESCCDVFGKKLEDRKNRQNNNKKEVLVTDVTELHIK